MKTILLTMLVGAFISTSLISCSNKKCGYCYVNGNNGQTFCSADNKAVYDAAVSSCTTGGGSWVTTKN